MNAELELDHIFVCMPSLAADAQRLVEFGLQPGRSRIHAGQGTEDVCFFFDNAYLELLGLHDQAEVRSPLVAPLRLWERLHWQQTGACPFGISLRLKAGTLDTRSSETWSYAAPLFAFRCNAANLYAPRCSGVAAVFFACGSDTCPITRTS
ncbi:hypothetical protein HPC62_01035 [Thermoleptolyngbya sichuanensis A183]|uniref:Glyoxalase-like domain-containing protein n=1 Tax=Thermoleptolyngbya sichuanensis A183 TaxID=2737172 RepID=A0A6M8B3G3_9CYAN|nr:MULTISPECIES: VOC family protein [Thermoleptolyngbya]QKD80938.1 hypothetical protein HPC62_01035 [Thermoleptolyngbya sichuanensis A183]